MRGKAIPAQPVIILVGITPAYAGKSLDLKWKAKKQQDHPRLCGEKVKNSGVEELEDRITPAYAGKSEKARNCDVFTGDHPRLCGEKSAFQRFRFLRRGSPPPMRGKVQISMNRLTIRRITPAYAGKSGF